MSGSKHTIVVGVDGSASSNKAVGWAAQYALNIGGTLRVVVAWSWPSMYGIPMVVGGLDLAGDAQRLVDKAAAELTLSADRLETRVVEGAAADVLLAASSDAELLVVGSHGHHSVDRVLLGSVSSYCLHDSKIPVAVIR